MKKMPIAKIALLAAIIGALLIPAGPSRAQEKTVTIKGGGYGHGIGMSQYGALGRAQRGDTAEQILEHYYTGAAVSERASSGTIKVGLIPNYGGNQGSLSFTTEANGGSGDVSIKIKGEKDTLVEGHAGDTFLVEASSTGGLRIKKNGKAVERGGKTVFGIDSGLVVNYQKHGSALMPNGKAHRYVHGKGEIGTYQSGACGEGHCINLALALPMQKYLYGLGEVPSSWPHPALKAQAIAGRTFAFDRVLTMIPSTRSCGCHVYDSTIDQAYIGDSKRTGSGAWWDDWKGAVDETKNQVVTHEGNVLGDALYSSSSGGHTESNEHVWGGAPVDYLRGVGDAPDKANGDNPNYRWTETFTWSQFQSMLSSYGVGEVQDIEIVKRGDSRRISVDGARLIGSKKSTLVDGWSLRGSLSLMDSLVLKIDMGGSAVGKQFRSKYNKLNGAPGAAKSKPYDVPRGWKQPRGQAQDFSSGRMTYIKESGKVVWQHGRILKAYDAMGRESSKLGMPSSGVWDGEGFTAATYLGGRLIKPNGHAPIALLGPFDDAFVRNGGASSLGVPLADREHGEGLPDGGRRQRFEHGTLYKRGAGGGVFALFREIDARFVELGQAASDCGYPTADMVQEGETWVASFEHGTMVLKASGKINVNCG